MKGLQDLIRKFLNDMAALPEDPMRVDLLGRRLKELGAVRASLFLHSLYALPDDDVVRKAKSLMVDPEGIRSAVGAGFYRSIYLASVEGGFRKISRLFTDLPPFKEGPYGYDKEEDAKMESMTLGERRTLSKGLIRDKLARLLADPDPMVVRNLLDNPRITEKDVLKIASKRPGSARILKTIAVHRVWSRRYDVIKALVSNPYALPRVTIALLDALLTQDLKAIAGDGSLHPEVTRSAVELVEERGGQ
ncbi:MAG TPA: hypothetical protein VNK06_05835 [Thermodesulfobacteriota bacterium]|nr:hypothetical protein [Thermodesulfobacteriota bacterium]